MCHYGDRKIVRGWFHSERYPANSCSVAPLRPTPSGQHIATMVACNWGKTLGHEDGKRATRSILRSWCGSCSMRRDAEPYPIPVSALPTTICVGCSRGPVCHHLSLPTLRRRGSQAASRRLAKTPPASHSDGDCPRGGARQVGLNHSWWDCRETGRGTSPRGECFRASSWGSCPPCFVPT